MNDAEQHEDVGSASFEFRHALRGGGFGRYAFNVKVGDNPDFWKARMLMHGAEFQGILYAVFVVDTGALEMSGLFQCEAWLDVGTSRFSTIITAADVGEARLMCREIGGFRLCDDPPLSRWDKAKCVLRWLWERRPVVRWRSPLDIF